MSHHRRILLVEDNEAILESMKELLEGAGYTIEMARNGLEALTILRSGACLPSLILLDLMMPLMDGYQFRAEQVRDPKIAKVPVVVMTADGQIEKNKQFINSNGYIKKPFEIEVLLAEVKRYFD